MSVVTPPQMMTSWPVHTQAAPSRPRIGAAGIVPQWPRASAAAPTDGTVGSGPDVTGGLEGAALRATATPATSATISSALESHDGGALVAASAVGPVSQVAQAVFVVGPGTGQRLELFGEVDHVGSPRSSSGASGSPSVVPS